MEKPKKPIVEPLLLTVTQAARVLGIGRGLLYKLIRKGEIHAVHLGRATRISVAELRRWVQAHDRREGSR